jgi:hypothetical protein
MKTKHVLFLFAIASLVAVAGCGSSNTTNPPATDSSTPAAVAPSDDPTPVEADASIIKIEKVGFSQTRDGVCWGAVLRNTDKSTDAIDVTVTVSFVAADGTILGSDSHEISVVPAGRLYYSAGRGLAEEEGVARIETSVDVGSCAAATYAPPEVTNVRVTWDDSWTTYRVHGRVTNTLKSVLPSSTRITAVVFDASGRVIGGGFGTLPADLPGGRRAAFSLAATACPYGSVESAKVSVDVRFAD